MYMAKLWIFIHDLAMHNNNNGFYGRWLIILVGSALHFEAFIGRNKPISLSHVLNFCPTNNNMFIYLLRI